MLKTFFLTLCAVCALLLVGCNKAATNSNDNSMAGEKAGEQKASPANSPSAMGSSSPTMANAGKIGVPECDEFLAAYEACISKVPEVGRAQYKATLASWRQAWLNAASTPQGKAGLATTCKAVIEQSRASMKPLGCNF